MRKSFLKALGYFTCLAWSSLTSAVGFGGINVTSSLGQPLVAEIELVAVDKGDKASLNAHLASPEAFKGAGIDYPYSLPKLKFEVATRANGESYIKATSTQAVNEPFVSLLLEVTWSSGRLLREYTFLLDPPGFVAEQPPVAAVKPIEPVVASAVPAAEPIVEAAPLPVPVPLAVEAASAPMAESAPQAASSALAAEPVATEAAASAVAAEVEKPAETKVEPIAKEEPAVVEAPAKAAVESNHASSITVKRGDTLSKIANQSKAADVSLERMLVALYHANTEAFDGHNMNRLRTGKILRQPDSAELAKVQQAEAVNEVRAQVDDWNAYRQKLSAAPAAVDEQKAKHEVAGKISTSIADKAPAAKESAKEVLKLSKGDAAGDQAAAGGKAKSAKDKAMAKEEDAIAKAKALKEAEERTALLEKNVKDMQRLVELKNQAAAKAEQEKNSAASAPASAIPLMASSVAATSAVGEAKPKPKAAAPKVVAPQPSFIDEFLENPVYLGGGAAVLLGLVGLGVARARKGKTVEKKKLVSHDEIDSDIGGATGRFAAPIQSSPDTGDFTHAPAPAAAEDEVDPIGEADLFLNFGRDVQAEEVLKEALLKDPSNNPVRLKLLSIYADRKDTKSFYVYALEIKESRDEAAWAKAAAMGRALEPGNALYGGSAESAAVASVPAENAAPAVDFDLGLGGVVDAQEVPQSAKTMIISEAEMQAAQEAPMDFDVTGTHPGAKALAFEEPELEVPAMDFDVTGTHPGLKSRESTPALDIPAMDFNTASAEVVAPAAAAAGAPALNLDDLVFDAAPAVAAPVAETDKGMEFTIDFPSEAKPVAAAPVKDVGLSEISLNLDDTPSAETAPAAETKDEHWQEVATKLDLAKAYQEMGDQAGAREILEEVVRDGDAAQRETAQSLLQQMA